MLLNNYVFLSHIVYQVTLHTRWIHYLIPVGSSVDVISVNGCIVVPVVDTTVVIPVVGSTVVSVVGSNIPVSSIL